MASKSAKRKAAVADSDRGDEKRFKKENKSDKVPGTTTTSADQFLQAVTAFILPASIQKARLQIFKTQLKKYGGAVEDKLTSACTHVIVDDNMEIDRLCRLLKLEEPPQNTVIVKCAWLSACLREKHFVDVDAHNVDVSKYFSKHADTNIKKETAVDLDQKLTKTTGNEEPSVEVDKPASSTNDTNTEKLPKVGMMFGAFKRANNESGDESDADSDYVPSDGEAPPGGKLYDSDSLSSGDDFPSTSDVTGNSSSSPSTSPHKPLPRGNWVCAQSSKTLKPNFNKHITDKLEEMVKTYQSTNDRWRALGYQKAIQAIRKHPKAISSWEEAKALPGVGARLADKVWEIAESGELRKLNEFRSSEELKVISLFTDVWGAGAHTARTWYQQGLRSLDDLKSKANLTKQQKIGLCHYDDFLDRMPRSEVEEIQTTVRTIAEELVPGTRCEVCGSYRRGKPTCGDIDILITHPDGKSHRGIFAKLLGRLREEGYLTDDLVSGEENGNQKKYMGVFRLKGENRKHRRIDIIVTPVEEYACALVHFTGSAHFNRSIRHLAKKMGMSLSEHALRTGVIRKGGEKIFEGTALPTPTEESIFRHMGIPHRPPEERDH